MPESYFVECVCHHTIPVELYEAGTEKVCPLCQAAVAVPNTTKLKESTGDKYPLLNPLEKILQTAAKSEPPFSGICHGCGKQPATYLTPILLDALIERHVADGNGIYPTFTGGFVLVAAATEEHRRSVAIPLLLCDDCQLQFDKSHSRHLVWAGLKFIGVLLLLVGFIVLAFFNMELVAALSGLLSLIGAIAWVMLHRNSQRVDSSVVGWAKRIRWMPEALAAYPEINLSSGHPSPLKSAGKPR